jgi:hypothetical protein
MTSDVLVLREVDAGTSTAFGCPPVTEVFVAEGGGTDEPDLLECTYVNGSVWIDNASDLLVLEEIVLCVVGVLG